MSSRLENDLWFPMFEPLCHDLPDVFVIFGEGQYIQTTCRGEVGAILQHLKRQQQKKLLYKQIKEELVKPFGHGL